MAPCSHHPKGRRLGTSEGEWRPKGPGPGPLPPVGSPWPVSLPGGPNRPNFLQRGCGSPRPSHGREAGVSQVGRAIPPWAIPPCLSSWKEGVALRSHHTKVGLPKAGCRALGLKCMALVGPKVPKFHGQRLGSQGLAKKGYQRKPWWGHRG